MNSILARLLPFVPRALIHRVASRYVAGESRREVLEKVARIEADGFFATVDLLGENARSRDEVRSVVEEYSGVLGDLSGSGRDSHISVKLTHLGLRIDERIAREAALELVARAHAVGGFVQLDMEDSSTTDATLRIFRELRSSYENVGLAIQAYLRRSPADLRGLLDLRPNVRICKGIYREPPSLAFQGREEIRTAYLGLLRVLLEGGGHPCIATHDAWLVDRALELVRALPQTAYEFQMLLGVGHALRPRIRASGANLRLYCPYGADWHEYSLRRLRENPALVGYVLRGIGRRRGDAH